MYLSRVSKAEICWTELEFFLLAKQHLTSDKDHLIPAKEKKGCKDAMVAFETRKPLSVFTAK